MSRITGKMLSLLLLSGSVFASPAVITRDTKPVGPASHLVPYYKLGRRLHARSQYSIGTDARVEMPEVGGEVTILFGEGKFPNQYQS